MIDLILFDPFSSSNNQTMIPYYLNLYNFHRLVILELNIKLLSLPH